MKAIFTNKIKTVCCKGLLAMLVLFSLTARAQNPLSPALNFNVFLKNGATLINNETEGPVAMGGDLTLSQNSYQVSTNYTGTFTVSGVKVTLVVGGKVNYNGGNGLTVNQNGYVKIGDCGSSKTWYTDQNGAYSPIRITPGSDYNGSPRINLQANSQQLGVSAVNNPVCQGNLIDFAAAFTTMKASSASISLCTDNTNLTNSNGSPIPHTGLPNQVKLNLATGINTLNLLGSDMNNVTDFIYNNKPDANHILVINVNAPGTFNWKVYNSGGIGLQECQYILYNFYNTTTLNVEGYGAVEGTVFAPYADIVKTSNQANIEGQIVAQSYIHNGGENHYPVFSANIPGCGVSCNLGISGAKTNISCHNANNGAINITVTGANGAVSYLWNDGNTSEDRTGLAAGTYSVTAKDAANCSISSETFTITNPDAIVVTGVKSNITCHNANNGAIDISVAGCTGAVSYLWNDGNTSEDRTGLAAGNYSVTVTDSKGCSATSETFTITNPDAIVVTGVKSNIICHDANNGAINISVSGCTGAVSYLWNDGNTSEDRTGLAAGSYSVTVTDSKGCSATSETFTISNPSAIAVTGTVTDVSVKNGHDGAIDVSVSGGTGSYTYSWSDCPITTQDRTNLSCGAYIVTVTDEKGCTAEEEFIVSCPANQPPVATDNGSTTNVNVPVTFNITSDDSDPDGTVDPSTVDLDPSTPGQQTSITTPEATWTVDGSGNVTFTPANNYTGTAVIHYTVNDNDGQVSNVATLTVIINADPCKNFNAKTTATNPVCWKGKDGYASVTVTGGSGNYSYLWSNGGTGSTISNLGQGAYYVYVTDNDRGCKDTALACIISPARVRVKVFIKPNTGNKCNGKVTLTPMNGTAPYTYLWNDGNTSSTRSNLCGGIYKVTVTDAKGCSSLTTFTVGSNCNLYLTNIEERDATCAAPCSGYFCFLPTGGTAPYNVVWDDGFVGHKRNNLCAGPHSGTVTDAKGCSIPFTVTIGKDCDVCTKAMTKTTTSNIIINGSPVNNNAVIAADDDNDIIIYDTETTDFSVKPNPARDFIDVITTAGHLVTGKLNILNMNGQVVKTKVISLVEGKNTVRVDLSGVAQGRYQVQLVSGTDVQTATFIIVK